MTTTRGAYSPAPVSAAARLAQFARRRPRIPSAIGIAIVAVLHAVLLLAAFAGTGEEVVLHGFIHQSYQDSGRVLDGSLPYRDFLLEYPPGTLLFMLIPRLAAAGYLLYRSLFFLQVAVLDGLIVAALALIARGARLPVARVVLAYTLGIAALGPLVLYRLDLAPAALTIGAILAWQRNRPALAAVALAAGAATKVYPLLLLPPLLVDQWVRARPPSSAGGDAPHHAPSRREFWITVAAFGITLVIFLSPALLAGPDGVAHSLQFQVNRNLQVESLWATPALLWHVAFGYPLQIAALGRALVVLGPGDALGQAGTVALVAACLVIYARWWLLRRRTDLHQNALLIGSACLILAAAVLGKVLSPQYLLWVMPAMAALPLRRLCVAAALLVAAALPLTQWIYPLHYGQLVQLIDPSMVLLLAVRNILLVVALALLLAAFVRLGR